MRGVTSDVPFPAPGNHITRQLLLTALPTGPPLPPLLCFFVHFVALKMDLLLDSCDFVPEAGVEASLVGGGGDPLAASPRSEPQEEEEEAEGEGQGGGGAGAGRRRRRDRWWRGTGAGGEGGGDGCLLTAAERFDGRVLLRPEESHQLMYSVRRKSEAAAAAPPPLLPPTEAGDSAGAGAGAGGGDAEEDEDGGFGEGSHALGRVEVCWRTTMGESGSVQSGPITFQGRDRPEVEVRFFAEIST